VQELRKLALSMLGPDTVLYTTDPPWATARGGLPDTMNFVDFGPGIDVKAAFELQKAANKEGQSPPICSEYYTGWLTHWGEAMANTCAPSMSLLLVAPAISVP
jgi:beta-galactosidase